LGTSDARTWLFGGWAEELRGLRAHRPHTDIDLLYPAAGFAVVESLLASDCVEEIEGKRFPHKRAFVFEGVMTELFLVCRDELGLYTMFWGDTRHDWPNDTLSSPTSFEWPVASSAALMGFRQYHRRLAARREAYVAQDSARRSASAGTPAVDAAGKRSD
jgi:hypothetical protein